MTWYMAGMPKAAEIKEVYLNDKLQENVTEVNTETGLVIRLATKKEIEALKALGYHWPWSCDVKMQFYGEVRIVFEDGTIETGGNVECQKDGAC